MPACDLAVSDVNRTGTLSSKEAYCDLYVGGGSSESTMLSCKPRQPNHHQYVSAKSETVSRQRDNVTIYA